LLSSSQLDGLRVVLVAARNPLNIGAAARAMSNFGFSHLRVVNPYQVAFREAKSAVGAEKLLADAEEYSNVAEAVADCTLVVGTTALHHRELQHPMYRLDEADADADAGGAERIRQQLAAGRVALLFGSEKRGLANTDLSHCNFLMRIPTRDEHSSMNLGQAVALCLYEIVRESGESRTSKASPAGERSAQQKDEPLAPAADSERLTQLLLDALRASGYVKRGADELTEEKVRRMVRRLHLQNDDAQVWLGMLRKILYKLRGPENS
jgi:tRNA/rRNA methyltransferase